MPDTNTPTGFQHYTFSCWTCEADLGTETQCVACHRPGLAQPAPRVHYHRKPVARVRRIDEQGNIHYADGGWTPAEMVIEM